MSESQPADQCTKCDFNFLVVSGIKFNFCPQCGSPRVTVKPELADREPTSNVSSAYGSTSINGHENRITADMPDTSHADQGEVHDSTAETFSVVEDTVSPSRSPELGGVCNPRPPRTELAKSEAVSTEKNSSQREQKETEQLTTDENDMPDTWPADKLGDPKIIHKSDCTSAQTHDEAGQVEEEPIPEDRTPKGITNSLPVSSNNQVLSQTFIASYSIMIMWELRAHASAATHSYN